MKGNNRLELIKKKKKAVKDVEEQALKEFKAENVKMIAKAYSSVKEYSKEGEKLKLRALELEYRQEELKYLEYQRLEEVQERSILAQSSKLDLKDLRELFNKIDYNTFCLIVTIGNIRGRYLMALYKGSEKLREYCDRGFQPVDKDGKVISDVKNQYLFRMLLNSVGILNRNQNTSNSLTPSEIYFERTIGGRVYGFGETKHGRLGIKTKQNKTIPTINPYLKDIIRVSAGHEHSFCLDGRGRVWVFGKNEFNQLGIINVFKTEKIPLVVQSLINIIEISVSYEHSLCLNNEGRVWAIGNNSSGQLGGNEYRNRPVIINNLEKIVQVSCGNFHSICLDADGHVWTFGKNSEYQLGLGFISRAESSPNMIPDFGNIAQISSSGHGGLCLDQEGRVWSFGCAHYGELGHLGRIITVSGPTLIPVMENIVQVSAGGSHSLCLDRNGRVWAFGYNNCGQLGLRDIEETHLPTLIPPLGEIVQISAGNFHSLCIDKNGKVWAFGSNRNDKLGLGNNNNDDEDNSDHYNPSIILDLNNVIEVSAGDNHSLCIVKP